MQAMQIAQRPVPLLTAELPGTSGLVRVAEDDFYVEELPLYEPSGAGEHLALTVDKRGRASLLAGRPIRDRVLRRMALSALQAELFNGCLAARIADGLFARAIDGDVLKKRATGGLFVCEDPRADAPRVLAGEVDPAGPLPGHSLFASRGEAARREQAVLAESHIDPGAFAS